MQLEPKEAGKILMKAMLEKQAFSAEETEKRFQQACSFEYWAELNPQLNVCKNLPFDDFEDNSLSEDERLQMLGRLRHEGYFATPQPLIKKEVSSRMLKAVQNLRNAGWHELWAFVYDEFWQVTRTQSFTRLLENYLGKNYKALPHVVVHYVNPETGAGWSPHIDFSDRDDRFTVWFAISDATIDNGCMYIVSKNRINEGLLEKWRNMEDLNHKEMKTLLQSTHALPATAGSILAWEGDVIHWGTTSSKGVESRISLSVVYIRENIDPLPDEVPLLSPYAIPDFAQRMLAIGKAINFYNIHVLALNRYSEIGKRLSEKYKQQAISATI